MSQFVKEVKIEVENEKLFRLVFRRPFILELSGDLRDVSITIKLLQNDDDDDAFSPFEKGYRTDSTN